MTAIGNLSGIDSIMPECITASLRSVKGRGISYSGRQRKLMISRAAD